jgi:hypothetical protein
MTKRSECHGSERHRPLLNPNHDHISDPGQFSAGHSGQAKQDRLSRKQNPSLRASATRTQYPLRLHINRLPTDEDNESTLGTKLPVQSRRRQSGRTGRPEAGFLAMASVTDVTAVMKAVTHARKLGWHFLDHCDQLCAENNLKDWCYSLSLS